MADVTASVLIERICGVLALLVVGTIAIILLSSDLRSALGHSVVMSIPLMAGVSLAVLVGGYLLFGKSLVKWLQNLSGNRSRVAKGILRMINYTKKIPLDSMFVIFVLSAVFQIAGIVASFALARAINIDLPLILFLAIFPIVYILTVLPISLGGLGVREGALAYLLTRVGILPSDAVTLSFMIYLNWVFVSLIGGALQIVWKPDFAIDMAMGHKITFQEKKDKQPCAGLLIRSPKTGRLELVDVPHDLVADPRLVAIRWDKKKGDKVRKFKTGPDRIGELVVISDCWQAAEQFCYKIEGALVIRVAKAPSN